MGEAFSYLGRRAAAFAVDLAIALGVSALALLSSTSNGWLAPYDGAHLGASVTVAAFALVEGLTGRTPGKTVFRLHIRSTSGARPSFLQSSLRAVVFWICVAAPSSVAPAWLFRLWPVDELARMTLVLASYVAILVTPLITVVFARENVGLHDFLTHTAVVPTNGDQVIRWQRRQAQRQAPSWPRLVSCLSATWVVAVLASAIVEWRTGVDSAWYHDLNHSAAQLAATASSRVPPGRGTYVMLGSSLSSAYYHGPDDEVILPGRAQYFMFAVSAAVMRDSIAREKAAVDFYNSYTRFVKDPRAKWVDIELFNERQFGFLYVREESRFLRAPSGGFLFPAPRRASTGTGTVKNQAAAELRPYVSALVAIDLFSWRFPSVDVLSRDAAPSRPQQS